MLRPSIISTPRSELRAALLSSRRAFAGVGAFSAGVNINAPELVLRRNPAFRQLDPVRARMLRFAAFNQRTTPEVPASVSRVAADLMRDPHSGLPYFLVRIKPNNEALAALRGLKLVPGMPVEAYIETGQRSALSYLMKPLTDQVTRAFKER